MSLRGAIPSFGPVCTLPGSVVNPQAWVGFLSKWRLINMYRLEKVCLQQLQTKWRLWCLSCRWRRRESRLVYLLQVWIELHAVADDATALSAAPQPCSAGGNFVALGSSVPMMSVPVVIDLQSAVESPTTSLLFLWPIVLWIIRSRIRTSFHWATPLPRSEDYDLNYFRLVSAAGTRVLAVLSLEGTKSYMIAPSGKHLPGQRNDKEM